MLLSEHAGELFLNKPYINTSYTLESVACIYIFRNLSYI